MSIQCNHTCTSTYIYTPLQTWSSLKSQPQLICLGFLLFECFQNWIPLILQGGRLPLKITAESTQISHGTVELLQFIPQLSNPSIFSMDRVQRIILLGLDPANLPLENLQFRLQPFLLNIMHRCSSHVGLETELLMFCSCFGCFGLRVCPRGGTYHKLYPEWCSCNYVWWFVS